MKNGTSQFNEFFFTLLIKIGIDEPPNFKKEFLRKGAWALVRILMGVSHK